MCSLTAQEIAIVKEAETSYRVEAPVDCLVEDFVHALRAMDKQAFPLFPDACKFWRDGEMFIYRQSYKKL